MRPVIEGNIYVQASLKVVMGWIWEEEEDYLYLLMVNCAIGLNVLFILESYMSKNSKDNKLAKNPQV